MRGGAAGWLVRLYYGVLNHDEARQMMIDSLATASPEARVNVAAVLRTIAISDRQPAAARAGEVLGELL